MRADLTSDAKMKTDAAVKKDALLEQLKSATPQQIDAWCDNNITNVNEAKEAFKTLFKLAAYTLRRLG